jgi:hypothetical protein
LPRARRPGGLAFDAQNLGHDRLHAVGFSRPARIAVGRLDELESIPDEQGNPVTSGKTQCTINSSHAIQASPKLTVT